jgi:hypothetical protein
MFHMGYSLQINYIRVLQEIIGMKTTATLLAALLVMAMPFLVFAQGSGDGSDESGLGGGEDVDISESTTRPAVTALGVLGKGIAVSPDDPMDFMLAKVGLGAVKVTIEGDSKRTAIGVLILDGEKYRLKDVSVVDGQATGDIYKDDESVGSLDVASVEKEDVEVWAGEMDLDGDTYHLYIIEGVRRIRAPELREKVADYCRNNPDDTNCRDKVEEFCENNPNDERCKAIFRKYCIAGNNMDDMRCREYVKDYCSENQNLSECVTLGVSRARAFCENNPESVLCRKIDDRLVNFCQNNTDNEGCVRAKEVLKNRTQVLNRIRQVVRKEISELRPEDAANVRLRNTNLVGTAGV